MKLLSLVFVFLLVFSGQTQNHLPFPGSGALWQIDHISMGVFYPMDQIGVTGDTLINNINYHKITKLTDTAIWDPFPTTHIGSVREEDSLWWFIKAGESNEFVLYDFSVETGDTISVNNPWIGTSELIVTDTDSLLLLGSYRKRIQLLNPLGEHEFWIEGIGSSNGILYSGQATWDEGNLLMCFHENSTLTYMNPEYNDCTYSTVGLNAIETNNESLIVFPNPVNEVLRLSGLKVDIQGIRITDLSGNLIMEMSVLVNEIKVSNLSSGCYFISVETASSTLTKKWIKD